VTVRVGLTLPSFVEDPEVPIAIAHAADEAELDGVFVFDHLWRGAPPNRRPALECLTLLGAVAAATKRTHVGTLVARATLRPPATLANGFDTANRVSNGRLIAGIGTGDSESRPENEAYGLDFGTLADRIDTLHDAVRAAHGHGYPVWVGGRAKLIREVAAIADGWNTWGPDPALFAEELGLLREVAPDAVVSWGGLARPSEEGADGLARRLEPYVGLGAEWIIVGPVDSSNVDNVAIVADVRARLRQ
jgi:alkanesulfonate monooxygenase SsuD/methylene tetrahydromethanopterin reductase-like flavin-dependent oxidoreductase (luciferase family)